MTVSSPSLYFFNLGFRSAMTDTAEEQARMSFDAAGDHRSGDRNRQKLYHFLLDYWIVAIGNCETYHIVKPAMKTELTSKKEWPDESL